MSSLTGEAALRDGISYECLWVAFCLVDLLEETAETIEIAGRPSEEGVDIRISYPDRVEHHQVKRMRDVKDKWTISSFRPVLEEFGLRLADPKARCHFISKIPVPEIEIFTLPARRNKDVAEFLAGFPEDEKNDYRKLLAKLSVIWAVTLEQVWNYLGRMFCSTRQETDLLQDCRRAWSYLVEQSETAISLIPAFALTHFHGPLHAADVWAWLQGKGITRRPFEFDPRIFDRIDKQTNSFLSACRRHVFIEPPLRRQVADDAIARIKAAETSLDVAVLGLPGGGKSVALHQVVAGLQGEGFPVLAFQLHDFPEQCSPQQFREQIDFYLDPVFALTKIAGLRPPVLVIDQLDSISIYSGRGGSLRTRVEELIDAVRVRRLRMVFHLVLACRAVDWKHDDRLRRLHIREESQPRPECIVIEVPPLKDAEIDSVLQAKGLTPALFTKRQRDELLRVPQNLRLLIAVPNSDASKIRTSLDLQCAFEAHIRRNPLDGYSDLWPVVTRTLTEKLAGSATHLDAHDPQQGCLSAPASTLQQFPMPYLDYLQSQGVLYQAPDTKRWRFAHETLFDYCFAQYFIASGESLAQWLETSDQTLRQRTQVRQVLTMLRDENPSAYLRELNTLLNSIAIRPHVKAHVADFLCSLPEVGSSEWGIIEPRIRGQFDKRPAEVKDWLSARLFGDFFRSESWFRYVLETGVLEVWLQSDTAYEQAWNLVIHHQPGYQQEVWPLIKTRLEQLRFQPLIKESLPRLEVSLSRETFEWFSTRIVADHFAEVETDNGAHRGNSDRHELHTLFSDLIVNKIQWLFEVVNMLIAGRLKTWTAEKFIFFDHYEIPEQLLREAIEKAPVQFVEIVLPCLLAAIEETAKSEFNPWYGSGSWSFGSNTSREDDESYSIHDGGLAFGVLTALKLCVDSHAETFRKWIFILGKSDAPGARRIGGAALKAAPYDFADDAWEFLMAHPDTFDLDGFPQGEEVAEVILRRFASHWKRKQVEIVEEITIRFVDPRDRGPLYGDNPESRRQEAWWRRRRRGRLQLRLLPLLPQEWLSDASKRQLGELRRRAESLCRAEGDRKATRPVGLAHNATARWNGSRWIRAFRSASTRPIRPDGYGSPFTARTDCLEEALRCRADENPETALQWLLEGGDGLPWSFSGTIVNRIRYRIRETVSLVQAAQWMFRQRDGKHENYVWELLSQIQAGPVPDAALEMIVQTLQRFPCEQDEEFRLGSDQRLQEYEMKADSTAQGKALKALAHLMQLDASIYGRFGLPFLFKLLDGATVFTLWGWLRVVLSIACSDEDREHSFTMFSVIVHHRRCDDHILCSPSSMRFMAVGLRQHLEFFRPFVLRMMASESEIIRSKGAELAVIAGFYHPVAQGISDMAIHSECEYMRKAAAEVACGAIRNESVSVSAQQVLLALANDSAAGVRKKVGWSLRHLHRQDLGPFQAFIKELMRSASFSSSAQHLASALKESPTKLPELAFDFIRTFLNFVTSGSDSDPNERAVWAHTYVKDITLHLYHENPEIEIRRRALDLIDELCSAGLLSERELDGVDL